MPGIAQYYNIPQPKGWPHRVRSAVIQVISLAHFCLTNSIRVSRFSSTRKRVGLVAQGDHRFERLSSSKLDAVSIILEPGAFPYHDIVGTALSLRMHDRTQAAFA